MGHTFFEYVSFLGERACLLEKNGRGGRIPSGTHASAHAEKARSRDHCQEEE